MICRNYLFSHAQFSFLDFSKTKRKLQNPANLESRFWKHNLVHEKLNEKREQVYCKLLK